MIIHHRTDHVFFSVRVSVDILKVYLNMNLERGQLDIQWPTLRYLIGEGTLSLSMI